MSLRLCSLAPWTISSSAAIEEAIVSTERVFVQRVRFRPLAGGNGAAMADTARRAAVVTLVVGGIVVLAIVLWKVKLLLAILFLGFILAAAIRPSIEALRRRGIPRGVGLAIHYLAFVGLLAVVLWLVVPRALDQVDNAVGNIPETRQELGKSARQSEGIKADILRGLQNRLREVRGEELIQPATEITRTAFEILVATFFVFATGAYWIFERNRAVALVIALVPKDHRRTTRDTWDLIDAKLGAYIRGQTLLVALVGTALSLAFWAAGLPYWLLIGVFAGLVELIPVIGPLAAGALAVGVGLTVSVHTAVIAGVAVLVVRLLEDYLVIPRVLGEAVGLSPLVVLASVSATGILFGGFAVFLAIPLAAVVVTLVDVIVRGRDPAEQEVPTVIFSPAADREG
jgi:predicted PurR-regulated permease PerM